MTTRRARSPRAPRRGRPAGGTSRLGREVVLDKAAELLERGAGELSVRELARELGVDPMAIYHYCDGRDALLLAVAEHRFGALRPDAPPFDPGADARAKFHALCDAYLRVAAAAPALVRLLARGLVERTDLAERFDALFDLAVGELGLAPAARVVARDVVVDYVHGHALAARSPDATGWREGLEFLYAALAARGGRAVRRR